MMVGCLVVRKTTSDVEELSEEERSCNDNQASIPVSQLGTGNEYQSSSKRVMFNTPDDLLNRVAQFVGVLTALAGEAYGIWCTVIAFKGGPMPLTGWWLPGGFLYGLFWLFIIDPLVMTVCYWAGIALTMPFIFIASLGKLKSRRWLPAAAAVIILSVIVIIAIGTRQRVELDTLREEQAGIVIGYPKGWKHIAAKPVISGGPDYVIAFSPMEFEDYPGIYLIMLKTEGRLSHAELWGILEDWIDSAESGFGGVTRKVKILRTWGDLRVGGEPAVAASCKGEDTVLGEAFGIIMVTATPKHLYIITWASRPEDKSEMQTIFHAMIRTIQFIPSSLNTSASPTVTAAPKAEMTHHFTATPSVVDTVTSTPTSTSTPKHTETPLPPTTANIGIASLTSTPAPLIRVTINKYTYEQWGRPAGMDDPEKGCGNFDDSRPVRVLTVDLHIENVSRQDMKDWSAYFVNPDDDYLYVCYHPYDGKVFPIIPARESRDVAFKVFFEIDDSVAYGFVYDDVVGASALLTFP